MLNQQNILESNMFPAQPPTSYPSSGGPICSPASNYPMLPAKASVGSLQTQNSQTIPNISHFNTNNSMPDTSMIYSQNGNEQLNQAVNSTIYSAQTYGQTYVSNNDSPNCVSRLNDEKSSQSVKNNPIKYTNGSQVTTHSIYSNPSIQSFQQSKQATSGLRSSHSSLESSTSGSLMPLNVKSMLLNGVSDKEVMCTWLKSIKCEEYTKNFLDNGYDMQLLPRMTPQDLTAIGCKSVEIRKKLLLEIRKLNLEDGIPECRPHSLENWLDLLKLSDYYVRLCDEGYDTIDKVCELTWEDLEDIGVNKLGHQKRLLLGIERVLKFDKQQEERQNDYAIYDVHPNHRISLNPNNPDDRLSTISRSKVRSGFFQTKSGANLDHRGLPVATVIPALKNINNSIGNFDISHRVSSVIDIPKGAMPNSNGLSNNRTSVYEQNNQMQSMCPVGKGIENGPIHLDDQTTTLKRYPPPLPPVRTNSLKIPQDLNGQFNNNNLIYGNNYGVSQGAGMNYTSMTMGSTSFLKTPKLGTLTATTNKMLTSGGHIQSINGQSTLIRSIIPVREAPLPPIPKQPPPTVIMRERIEEEPIVLHNYPPVSVKCSSGGAIGSSADSQLINQSSISHQLASADEFPPPPPPPT